MLAGHGPVAVLAGGLVTVNLRLGMLATARHARMIRFGRSLNDGVFLAATLIIAVTPVGGRLTEWWLAVPLLYAYAGGHSIALSLAAWLCRGRWPASVTGRVVNRVHQLLLRDRMLAVFVASVFHADSRLMPAAAGLAAAELLPVLVSRFVGNYRVLWFLDVPMLTAQPPDARWVLWEQWARDALLAPRRPDDSLLRVMVTRDGLSRIHGCGPREVTSMTTAPGYEPRPVMCVGPVPHWRQVRDVGQSARRGAVRSAIHHRRYWRSLYV